MTVIQRLLEVVAVLLVGAAAGWALLAPQPSTFAIAASDGQFGVLATSLPLAAAVGCALAAAVAGSLPRRGTARSAWATATLGIAAVMLAALANEHVGQVEWLIVANYATGIGAGLALGAAAAAASSRTEAAALVGGAFAAFLLAPPLASGFAFESSMHVEFGWTAYTPLYSPLTDADSAVATPPMWLTLPALVCAAALTNPGRGRLTAASTRGLTATVLVVTAALVTNAAIGTAADNWALAAPLTAVLVLAVGTAAFVLDDRDGRLVLTTTAIVATAAPLLAGTVTTALGVAILGGALALGLLVGARRPNPVVGLSLLAVIGAFGLLPDFADGMQDAVRWLALAPVAGYALGSCTPVRGGATVAALTVLFVPSALTVAGQSSREWFEARSPFTALPRGLMSAPSADPRALGLVAALVAAAAAVAAGILTRRRTTPD